MSGSHTIAVTQATREIAVTQSTVVIAISTGANVSIPNDSVWLPLIKLRKEGYTNGYDEVTYTGDKITKVETWDTALKGTKLFTRTITYSGDDIDTITTVDELAGLTLTQTRTYTGDKITTLTDTIS